MKGLEKNSIHSRASDEINENCRRQVVSCRPGKGVQASVAQDMSNGPVYRSEHNLHLYDHAFIPDALPNYGFKTIPFMINLLLLNEGLISTAVTSVSCKQKIK